jgi:protein tyrosine phosphatase (PTP) superfamily phosphohydrolase (DUF442 family)
MEAENTHQVFDWLWSSGQLSGKDIASLPALGIDAVINLALPTSSNALPGEAEMIARQGIAYIQIPVEWERPELQQLLQFFGVLKAFEGRKVWVHCARNMRVSAFIYLYRRLCLAQSEEAAVHPMQEVWVPNETWQAFIRSSLATLSRPAFAKNGPKCTPHDLNIGHQ